MDNKQQANEDEAPPKMERLFPLQVSRDKAVAAGPLAIPWCVAEKAYGEYARRYGRSQSLEELARRGGFGWNEMDLFYPQWREESSELIILRRRLEILSRPVDMLLFCPQCHTQHVDKPEPERGWDNPPHKSHLCHNCGVIWRPADVPTNGVDFTKTSGVNDTWKQRVMSLPPSPSKKGKEFDVGNLPLPLVSQEKTLVFIRANEDEGGDPTITEPLVKAVKV